MLFSGKNIIVTGATGDLGVAIGRNGAAFRLGLARTTLV
jgi:hypothetical protein